MNKSSDNSEVFITRFNKNYKAENEITEKEFIDNYNKDMFGFGNVVYRKRCKNDSWKNFIKKNPENTYFLGYKESKYGYTNNSKHGKTLYSSKIIYLMKSKLGE